MHQRQTDKVTFRAEYRPDAPPGRATYRNADFAKNSPDYLHLDHDPIERARLSKFPYLELAVLPVLVTGTMLIHCTRPHLARDAGAAMTGNNRDIEYPAETVLPFRLSSSLNLGPGAAEAAQP